MKKLLLIVFLIPFFCSAQDAKPTKEMYAEIVGTSKLFSSKIYVEIDYGQGEKAYSWGQNRIIDEATGRPRIFNSMVDAMNFMGTLGWKFVQAYVVTDSGTSVFHWIMKLELSDSEMEEALPMIKGDLKKD